VLVLLYLAALIGLGPIHGSGSTPHHTPVVVAPADVFLPTGG